MTINELYRYVLDVSNKDTQGLTFSPAQFNNILSFVNTELFQKVFEQVEASARQGGYKLSDMIFQTADLKNFIDTQELITGTIRTYGSWTINELDYPVGYKYPLAAMNGTQNVSIWSASKLAKARTSVLNQNFNEHPVAIEKDGCFEIIPGTISSIVLTFLRAPAAPYYDWCLSEYDEEIFMPVGSYIQYSAILDYYSLYEANSTLIERNVTHDSIGTLTPNPAAIYTSLTTELEWDELKHTVLANRVLEKLGVNLRAPEVTQYAMNQ